MSIKRFYYVAWGLFLALFLAAAASASTPTSASSKAPSTNSFAPALTATPSPGPSCASVTGSTPRCFWPNTMSYYFGLYNSCNVTLTGSGAVQLELAPTSSGPWTVYNQQAINTSLPPGSSYVAGNFVENNIPPEYHSYRFTLALNTSNGQTLNSTTVAAPLCNTAMTPTPTPTGITIRCYMVATGAQSTCSQPDAYGYDFGIYSHCDTTMPGTVQVELQVSPNQGGPWTAYDTRSSNRSYSPGVNTVQGTFNEPYIPPQYQWFRITMSASYPGPFGNRYVTSETQPAPICTGASTTTATPTVSPTRTAFPTGTACPNNYNYTVSTGTLITSATLLPGSQCGSCVVNVALPFPFSYYGQTYTSANLSTQGNLQFTTSYLGQNTCPLPEPLLGPAMMPHWDEFLETSYHPPCQAAMGSDCGIYTSVSGSAPNRVFNIEWRTRFLGTSQHTANFEIRLYENSTYFEYVYGWVSYAGGYASIGVQDGGCRFTSYSCNTWNNIQTGTRIGWGGQPTATPTIGPPCGILTFGNPGTTYCTSPTSYFYSFTFYVESGCPSSMNGTATVTFEVAPDSSGPWTVYDTQTYPVTFQRGWNGSTGTFQEPGIPSQYQWYRINYIGRFPNNVNAYGFTNPARRCDIGTVTPTTMTPTATPSRTATPTSCPQNYVYATATATIVPGITDIGNHCDDCLTQITLPFPYRLYDQTFNSIHLESNGRASFPGVITSFPVACFPQPGTDYTVFPYWEDLRTDCTGCGIFTSVSGTAPNRIFNVEWRANYFPGNGTANFEMRLYEGQPRFDVIYGVLTAGNSGSLAGVQKDSTYWTQYFCNGQGGDANNGRLVVYTLPTCSTPTSTSTPSVSPTGTIIIVEAADLVGELSWATSCPAPVLRLTSRNIGFPMTVPPSTMRITTNSGDFREFPVPAFNGSYSVDCEMGTCIPSSWSFDLPLTLRVDYYNTVQEGNESNNNTQLSNPPPVPTPCGPTPTRTHTATATGSPTTIPCNLSFVDVPPGNTFYAHVRCLACRGVVSGYSDGTFRPNNPVTRGQLSKIVSNAAGFSEPVSGQTFQDVPPTHTFYEFIQRLTTRGYMTGYPCGGPGEPCINNRPYFRPQRNATRGQTAKIVANAAQIETPIPPDQQTFEDVPPTHTFWLWIERLYGRNVMGGYPCGGPGEPCIPPGNRPYFRPGNDVTRGQAVKIVANTFFPNCPTP